MNFGLYAFLSFGIFLKVFLKIILKCYTSIGNILYAPVTFLCFFSLQICI
jgi:hypothetical protein